MVMRRMMAHRETLMMNSTSHESNGQPKRKPDHHPGDEPHQEDPEEGDGKTYANSGEEHPSSLRQVGEDFLCKLLQIQDVDDGLDRLEDIAHIHNPPLLIFNVVAIDISH